MNPLMVEEVRVQVERFCAVLAIEGLLPIVHLDVQIQLTGCGERLGALITLIRFLPRVR